MADRQRAGAKLELLGGQHRSAKVAALGWREADLDVRGQPALDVLGAEAGIAPGFQEAPGEVLGRAHAGGEGLAEQAAVLDQLGQGMGELQQEVEHFGRDRVVAETGWWVKMCSSA